jgi:hypothetical protein
LPRGESIFATGVPKSLGEPRGGAPNGGLFIVPIQEARQGWAKSINTILETHGEELKDGEWLDAKLSNDDELDRRAIPTS